MGTLDQQTADKLIVAMAGGDMHALEILYNAMYREIFVFLLSTVGNTQVAEDLAQDTFIRAYQYASGFVPAGYGKSWVYQIARRLTLTYFQKNGNHATEIALTDDLPTPDDAEERALNAQVIAQAMERLPAEERQIISLHALSGLTLREVADILDKPLGTVKWRHAQGLKKLREWLGDDIGCQ